MRKSFSFMCNYKGVNLVSGKIEKMLLLCNMGNQKIHCRKNLIMLDVVDQMGQLELDFVSSNLGTKTWVLF